MHDIIFSLRRFNRFYLPLLGLLNRKLLGSPLSLAEARALYEINSTPGLYAAELATALGMDRGQLSRMLARLLRDGRIRREGTPAGSKTLPLFITPQGKAMLETIEEAATSQALDLVAHLDQPGQSRLRKSLHEIQELLGRQQASKAYAPDDVLLREAAPGDLGWIVSSHAEYYGRLYGFSREFEGYVLCSLADYLRKAPEKGNIWIAELDSCRVGSIGVVHISEKQAQMRWLLVAEEARGLGLGKRLVHQVMDFCRQRGYQELFLWTLQTLNAARKLYAAEGFSLVEQKEGLMGGVEVVEECWQLCLETATANA